MQYQCNDNYTVERVDQLMGLCDDQKAVLHVERDTATPSYTRRPWRGMARKDSVNLNWSKLCLNLSGT